MSEPSAADYDIDNLVARSRALAGLLPSQPAQAAEPRTKTAIVACMDCRLDVIAIFGLTHGDAHILRNAGGVISDDVERSLVLSQRRLGTRNIVLVHHTQCGLQGIDEGRFFSDLETETGLRPSWPLHAFNDVEADVRHSITRLRQSPFLLDTDHIRGFVYDVENCQLNEVESEVLR